MSLWDRQLTRIHDWKTWPIGEKIIFRSPQFTGIGFIVANSRLELTVLWSGNCAGTLKTYSIQHLNENVIMRFVDYEIKRKTGRL